MTNCSPDYAFRNIVVHIRMQQESAPHVTKAEPRRSLRARLTLVIFVLTLVTAVAVGLIGYVFAQRTLKSQIEQRLRIVAADRHSMLLAYVGQQHERIGLVASRTQLRRYAEELQQPDVENRQQLRADAERILSDAKASTSGFEEIVLFDPAGNLLAATSPDEKLAKLSETPEFLRGKTTRHLGLPKKQGDHHVALLMAPAHDPDGELIAVIAVILDVTPLERLLSDPACLGETGEVRVGYIEGDTVHFLFPTRSNGANSLPVDVLPAMQKAVATEQGFASTTNERHAIFAVYRPVEYQDPQFRRFGMVAQFESREAFAPIATLRAWLLAVDVGLLLVGVLTAWWLARRITRPLIDLTEQVNSISTGDLSQNVTIASRDETGALALAFNKMTSKLSESYATLEARVERRTSELSAAHAALEQQAGQTRRIIDTATDAFVAMDAQGVIIDWNPAAEATFGWRHGDVIGKQVEELLIPPASRDAHRRGLARFLETGEGPVLGKQIEVTALHQDGRELPIELTINPMPAGDAIVFNAFIHDISERKRAEAQLLEAKAAAEDASRAKSDFLANMSHEIRTPMNAIMGMTDLLLDTDINSTQRDYLQTVLDSAEHLLTIINEILDFSKIEAGRVELEYSPFCLRESIGDTMKVIAFRAHRKNLELALHIAPDVPDGVVADSARLRQILINLVGNAIKFTEQGEILVDVSRVRPPNDDRIELQFCVRDTGIGISEDRRESIFESFTQADSSTTREYGGTGLGLSICQRLVELMGGRIWVESQAGRGSSFRFTVPVTLADVASRIQLTEHASLEGLRVLIVDDNATNLRILDEILRVWGLVPLTAADAPQAIQLFKKAHTKGQPVQLILTDLHMPRMDGMELIETIRSIPDVQQPTIIMLTSGERPGDAQRREDLRVSACLLKPLKQTELLDEVLAHLGSHQVIRPQEVATSVVKLPSLPSLTILVAEDGDSNRKLLAALLLKWGHRATFVTTGAQAVEVAGSERFDVVLMDVEMPTMDGLEASRRIRHNESASGTPHVPIIALTAHALAGDEARCLAAGMDRYVSKPIRAALLAEVISDVASNRPPTGFDTMTKEEMPQSPKGLDIDAALDALGGDDELLRIVTAAFLDESPRLLSEMHTAFAARDANGLRMAAHALKGAIRYYGDTTAYQLAYEVEVTANSGGVDDLTEQISRIDTEIQLIRGALLPIVNNNSDGPW